MIQLMNRVNEVLGPNILHHAFRKGFTNLSRGEDGVNVIWKFEWILKQGRIIKVILN